MSADQILRQMGYDPEAPAAALPAGTLVEALYRRLRAEPKEPEPEWLTTKQAARYAGRSAKTIAAWGQAEKIDARRRGGRAGNRYSRSSIDAYLGRER